MSWDYRIIAPAEAGAVLANPGEHAPRTPIGTYRAVRDWITSHAAEWHPRDVDSVVVTLGPDGYAELHLTTAHHCETQAMFSAGGEPEDNALRDRWREFKKSYVPSDDQSVVEISIEGRGSGDITLLAECAAAFNAVVFDCQSSEILT